MTPKKHERPEHFASGYSLHLYCDHYNPDHGLGEFPHEYTEYETLAKSIAAAKGEGWKINRNERTATCPKCVKALKRTNG